MKKVFYFKLLSVFLILWINWINIAQAQVITISNSKKLLGQSEYSISVKSLRKDCILYHGTDGVQVCEQLVTLTPSDPEAWNNLGHKYYYFHQYKKALFAYKQALELNSKYSLAWANMCGVLSQVKSYDLALKACDRALQNDSVWGTDGKALAWDNKGNVLFNLGRYQQSLDAFDRALDANPHYDNAYINRSIVLNHLKEYSHQEYSHQEDSLLDNKKSDSL